MGYYGTTCSNCGGPATFFSFSMSIECSNCRRRYDFVNLLVAWTLKVAGYEEKMVSSCTSVDMRQLEPVEILLPPEAIEKIESLIAKDPKPSEQLREAAKRFSS
jgi:hypothetical protein